MKTIKNNQVIKDSIFLDIELYQEDTSFCAYIGEENYSGYSIEENTIEKMLDEVKNYILTRITQENKD